METKLYPLTIENFWYRPGKILVWIGAWVDLASSICRILSLGCWSPDFDYWWSYEVLKRQVAANKKFREESRKWATSE